MTTSPRSGFDLLAISQDGTVPGFERPWPDDVAPMIEATKAFYAAAGFVPPWISYLATLDGSVAGGGAFVGAPANGAVEIAYFTLPDRQGQGIAKRIAAALVEIARTNEEQIVIQAKTLPEPGASTRVLERLGFSRTGLASDHEVGEAWLWTLEPGTS